MSEVRGEIKRKNQTYSLPIEIIGRLERAKKKSRLSYSALVELGLEKILPEYERIEREKEDFKKSIS